MTTGKMKRAAVAALAVFAVGGTAAIAEAHNGDLFTQKNNATKVCVAGFKGCTYDHYVNYGVHYRDIYFLRQNTVHPSKVCMTYVDMNHDNIAIGMGTSWCQ